MPVVAVAALVGLDAVPVDPDDRGRAAEDPDAPEEVRAEAADPSTRGPGRAVAVVVWSVVSWAWACRSVAWASVTAAWSGRLVDGGELLAGGHGVADLDE